MPRAGKIRQFLDALRVSDLRAVHRRFTPRVKSYESDSDRNAFVRRLRRSLKRSIDSNELSFADLVSFIVTDAEARDRRNNTTIIKKTLQNLSFSRHLMHKDASNVRERWICGETFQALRIAFENRPHATVELEKKFGRCSADICVTVGKPGSESVYHYPIEVKRASQTGNVKQLPGQLDKYRKYVRPKTQHIYVLAVGEVEGVLNRRIVSNVLNGARRRKDTTVIVKKRSSIRSPL
jgi:hypothetical protein